MKVMRVTAVIVVSLCSSSDDDDDDDDDGESLEERLGKMETVKMDAFRSWISWSCSTLCRPDPDNDASQPPR